MKQILLGTSNPSRADFFARQPGLTVRRRPDGSSMSDEEMAAHYSALARDMGGRMTCWYRNGYAVCCRGEVSGFMDPEPVSDLYTFWMVDKPYPGYTPGWPLDSLSVWPATGKYFVESRANHLDAAGKVLEGNHRAEILAFYAEKLGLERRETPRSVD